MCPHRRSGSLRATSLLLLSIAPLAAPAARAELSGDLVRLDEGLDTGVGGVWEVHPLPDGRHYLALAGENGRVRIYLVRLDGTAPVEVGPPEGAWNPAHIRFSPDSRRLFYIEFVPHPQGDAHGELWCVPLDGTGAPHQVSPQSPEYYGLRGFDLSPDGERVVFSSAISSPWTIELWGAPACGEPDDAVLLDATLAADEHVGWFRIAPDSQHVAYESQTSPSGPFLRSTHVDSSAPATLAERVSYLQQAVFVHEGATLVTLGWDGARNGLWFDDFPSGTGESVCVSCETPFAPYSIRQLEGDLLLVQAEPVDGGPTDLFRVDFADPQPAMVRIGRRAGRYVVSKDGFAAFSAETTAGATELRRVPIAGPISATATMPIPDDEWLTWFEFLPGSSDLVVYSTVEKADFSDWGTCQLWDVALGAQGRVALFEEPLRVNKSPRGCLPVPSRDLVLSSTWPLPPEPCCRIVLSRLEKPTGGSPLRMAGGDGVTTPLGIPSQFLLTPDEEWLLYLMPAPAEPTKQALWARRLPLFWDGFESGSTRYWTTGED